MNRSCCYKINTITINVSKTIEIIANNNKTNIIGCCDSVDENNKVQKIAMKNFKCFLPI